MPKVGDIVYTPRDVTATITPRMQRSAARVDEIFPNGKVALTRMALHGSQWLPYMANSKFSTQLCNILSPSEFETLVAAKFQEMNSK